LGNNWILLTAFVANNKFRCFEIQLLNDDENILNEAILMINEVYIFFVIFSLKEVFYSTVNDMNLTLSYN